MYPFRTAVVTTLVCLLAGAEAAAHASQSAPPAPLPPGAAPSAPLRQQRIGTSRIRGRVLSEAGAPIRRAQVLLAAPEVAPRSTLTDAAGRYEFADLPAGRFMIRSTKTGYLMAQHGQIRPFEAGKPIELADRQAVDNVDLLMPRGRAIVGRIIDDTGEPLTDAIVTVRRQQWVNGRRQWLTAGRPDQTNDLGEYRVYGLSPGAYQVSATARNMDSGLFETPSPSRTAADKAAALPLGYAPTYYPGSAAVADAHKVVVAPGQDTLGIDFQMVSAPLARITGVVVSSDGRPLDGAMLTLTQPRGADSGGAIAGSRTARDGTFTIVSVPPGEYTLAVLPPNLPPANAGDPSAPRVGPVAAEPEFGFVSLTVAGENLSAGVITTTKGATVAGRVTFEGERPPNITGLRVASTDDSGGMALAMISGGAAASVGPDGTFAAKGLTGIRLFRVLGLPNGWTTKSIRLGGVEVIDSGIELKGTEAVSGLEILLSPKVTEVSGSVVSAAGIPVTDYTVVLFSDDPTNWRFASGRWVSGARPGQDGRFRVRGLPAGSYYAVAVEYIAQGDWTDPDLLERLAAKALRLSLEEGQSKTLELKLTDGGW